MPNYSNRLKQDNPQIVSSPEATTAISGSQGPQGLMSRHPAPYDSNPDDDDDDDEHGSSRKSLFVYILRNQNTDMLLKPHHPNRV